MAEAVVSFVVQRLRDFTSQEAKFLNGVSDQVEHAQTELQLMRGFLRDADSRGRDDETISIWIIKIRDAAYDLEDVIEAFALKVAPNRKTGIKNFLIRLSCILKEGVDLHKIGSEIENIATKISNLRLSLQTYNVREIRESRGVTSLQLQEREQQLRRTYSHVIERDVVGLEDSAKELIVHLVKEEKCPRVVSIWGMGGLGKTTLAKHVYHHKEVRQHFSSFAWVCISQRCQVRDVWEGILTKLISPTNEQRQEIANMRDDEIAKKLYLVQQDMRCLVVLDDIWSIETWDSLKAAFPYEETKSKIVLTTRREAVALHPDRNAFLHQPRPLNENESLELFDKIALSGRTDDTSFESYAKMKELRKKMLRSCGGLPLAITVLAGLLARKDTVDEWDDVLKNVEVYIRRGKEHGQEYAGSLWVLAMSYDDLPYHLKLCFLYLGHFPEDSSIRVKRLTQLWMAEGFISLAQQNPGTVGTLEDVAYSWLSELVERCMVQVGEIGSIRKIKTCRLHDLMRDLSLLKAEEENFLQIVNFAHGNETMYPFSSSMVTKVAPTGKVRRLAIYLDANADKLVPSRDERDVHLRSLSYFTPPHWTPRNIKSIRSVFKCFKLLRVLKFEHMTMEVELSSEIGNLIHLRFLSLHSSHIKRLPSSVGNLLCLQTLDLRFYGSAVIPNVIWKMEQLRHLYLPLSYRVGGKLRLAPLRNLQTLQYVSTRDWDLNELSELTNLRKLFIDVYDCDLKNLEEIFKSTSLTSNRVQSLSVRNLRVKDSKVIPMIVSGFHQIYKLCLKGGTRELPNDLQYYPNLIKLTLFATDLKEDQMKILEKLQNLRVLKLSQRTFEEETNTLVFSEGGFPRLEFLSLHWMHEIKEWRVDEGAMPSLLRLHIVNCRGLTTVPDGLRYIKTLRELEITGMSTTYYSSLQEGGEDFYKIQHVPSLIFGAAHGEYMSSLGKTII